MNNKFIWLGLFIGTTIGGFIPVLWGSGALSLSGAFFSTLGGAIGIWWGYRMDNGL